MTLDLTAAPLWAHQRTALELSQDKVAFAYLMEQRTGKSLVTWTNALYLADCGEIDAFVLVAPNGVHRTWQPNEILAGVPAEKRTWLKEAFKRTDVSCHTWRPGGGGKFVTAEREALLKHEGLAVFLVNVEATITEKCRAYLERLFARRKVLLAIDECSTIKTPGAQRTKRLIALGRRAKYRRILTGTPVTRGPLDLWAPFAFLSPTITGYTSFFAFKHRYALWEQKTNHTQGRQYEELVGYQHLDELQAKVASHSFRVTRAECFDLPAKVYMPPRYFALSPEQRRAYDSLRDEYLASLDSGETVTAALAIVRLMRLQQIACGWFPADEPTAFEVNPRLGVLLALLEEEYADEPAVVWARFQGDVSAIVAALGPERCARYDGAADPGTRAEGYTAFRAGKKQYFVGNPAAGGYGLDLSRASLVVYYSNSFSAEQRWQSEDRAQHGNKKDAVAYVDLVAEDTVDERVVTVLRERKDVAELVTQGLRSFLR